MKTPDRASFAEREAHLPRLVELNRKARVDPAVIDLIEAYARLKLRTGRPYSFYSSSGNASQVALASTRPQVLTLARNNPDLDPRALAFLAGYAEEMARRGLPFVSSVTHLAQALGLSAGELATLRHSRGPLPHLQYSEA